MTKKEGSVRTVSFLDVFFLLVAGLVVSFGIYLFTEAATAANRPPVEVSLSAYVSPALQEAIPQVGDPLYGEGDRILGTVLSVEKEKTGNSTLLRVTCRMEGEAPEKGQEMIIETPGCIRPMWVYEVKETVERRIVS